MSQTASSINLLRDSRGRWYDLSTKEVLFVCLGGVSAILLLGISLGILIATQLLPKVSPVQATETTLLYPTPTPTPQLLPAPEEFARAQAKIAAAGVPPLTLTYPTRQGNQEVTLTPEILSNLLTTASRSSQIEIVINNPALETTVNDLAKSFESNSRIKFLDQSYLAPDTVLDKIALKRFIRDELFIRLRGAKPHQNLNLTPFLTEVPGTHGEVARKYIEVDISQQKLYQWEKGKVIATRIISTGKEPGWTPLGLHKIMNKAHNAWSPTAQVYTPYWMAYGFLDFAQAYVGFHGMPYNLGPAGKRLYRPYDTLGQPVTGGCIQLADNDATKLMNWAEVGTPVFIHE